MILTFNYILLFFVFLPRKRRLQECLVFRFDFKVNVTTPPKKKSITTPKATKRKKEERKEKRKYGLLHGLTMSSWALALPLEQIPRLSGVRILISMYLFLLFLSYSFSFFIVSFYRIVVLVISFRLFFSFLFFSFSYHQAPPSTTKHHQAPPSTT